MIVRPARRHPARLLSLVLTMAVVVTASSCRKPPPPAACAPGAPPPSVPSRSPWARTLCRQASQKPPVSVNGIIERDGVLWMASLDGGEIVAADGSTGEIIGRFGPDQGVNSPPDDLAMAADGTVYWSGFPSGDVGVLTPDGRSRKLTNVGAGVNPMVLGPDGAIYTCRFWLGSGFYRIDPASGSATPLNPQLQVNAFGFGPDGAAYAGTMNPLPSRLLRIDPATGQATTVAATMAIAVTSVRFPPPARHEAATTAYLLTGPPMAVQRRDVTTGAKAGPDIPLPLLVGDNMAFAPDGRLFVTAYTPAQVVIVGVDGSTRVLPIGRK